MQIINFILVAGIIASFAVYFYYKTKQFRATLPIRKKWYKAKAGVALGTFIIFFGLNATIIYPTKIGYAVAIIFVLLGATMINGQYKRARHEGKYVQEEYELNK